MGGHLNDVDGREAEHWTLGQAAMTKQLQARGDLDVFYRALREEFTSHAEFQRAESERLRHHSTQRYFEQMDKALNLHRSLAEIEVGHKELNETVSSIKLPPVA